MPNVPLLTGEHVRAAVSPSEAVDVVRAAFLAYARGEWTMPPKTYVEAYPAGDFRAMPALGAGFALLKWVTSFPGNPARGLPTVTGLVLLSSADDGSLRAVLDTAAVTARRTGAAAVLAAEVLRRPDAGPAAVVGAGVNGRAAAETLVARGHAVALWDVDADRAAAVAGEIGAAVAGSREEALDADVVVTVTPGHDLLFPEGSLRAGQHVSLMGADGPGKAEMDAQELARVAHGAGVLVVDEWEQASHGGDTSHAVERGLLGRESVRTLGGIVAGEERGRRSDADVTVFDSTGLAIQDLAIAIAAVRKYDAGELQGVETIAL
ncbi:MAG TPA: ornithine cyclodeaminase family protein [Gaiellaceae bacterium]|nr:ornithine cyclodeaminase family protein [Gaiellaceae bacterium]